VERDCYLGCEMSISVVPQLWERVEAREWVAARALLTPDALIEWPHTGERILGADNYIAIQREYPEGWHLRVQEIVSQPPRVACAVRLTHGGQIFACVAFYKLLDGQIAHGVEYWVTEGSETPPAWRAKWVER
jgi:hypothetical protein